MPSIKFPTHILRNPKPKHGEADRIKGIAGVWDVLSVKMDISLIDGIHHVTVHPDDLYPAVLKRIQYILETREIPYELNAPREEGGDVRGRKLVREIMALPIDVWADARTSRDWFIDLPVKSDYDQLAAAGLPPDSLNQLLRLKYRAKALDIALGWFMHALRIRIGGHKGRILAGDYRWKL
jgi:hypothetical protein